MLVRSLASNYLKRTLRSPFGAWILGGNLLMVLCFWGPVFLYAFYMGFSVVRILEIDHSVDLLARMNPVLLPVLMAWGFVNGMLFRGKAYVHLFPYLTTPTPRRTLAFFRQLVMLFSKLNLFVLAFIAGFWVKNLYLQDIAFAWNWLLALCLACACMYFATNILRSWRERGFLEMLGGWFCVAVLAALEWGYDAHLLSKASTVLFRAAAEGAVWPLMLLVFLATCLFYEATRRIRRSLYIDASTAPRLFRNRKAFLYRRKPRKMTAELLSFEWKLMLRNRQPRFLATTSMGVMLVAAWFLGGLSGEIEITVRHFIEFMLLFLFIYPLMYFVSALDFRYSFYDGMSVWPISEKTLLRTLLSMFHRCLLIFVFVFIVSIMCSALLFDGVVFFEWILMQGILLFGMGILHSSALLLNVLFPVPRPLNAGMMDLNTSLTVFVNAQAILMNIVLVAVLVSPVMYPMVQFVSGVWLGVTLCVLGLAGLCLQPWLTRLLARLLRARRYIIMGRFRIG